MCSRHGQRVMQLVDLNGDGSITQSEAAALQEVKFLRWDGNGDGVVTEDEVVAAARKRVADRAAKRSASMDSNGDGRIERAEFDAFESERFTRRDSDGDGLITGDELRVRQRDRGRRGPGRWRAERRRDKMLPEN